MRKSVFLISVLLFVSIIPASNAGKPVTLEQNGAVFGGLYLDANESGTTNSQLGDLPAIVEDYTATWCTNCLDVEEALYDVKDDNNMNVYHFHRFIGENEDPLGSQVGDDRWIERYEHRLPPTAIFNGTIRQIGSVPDGESLQADYTNNLANPLNLGNGISALTYETGVNGSSPTIAWHLEIDMSQFPNNSKIESSIWVVEKTAYFPDGGNGKQHYNQSVKTIITLGESLQGMIDITLPDAYDENDLEIHLIHEVILPEPVEQDPEDANSDSKDDESMPAINAIAVISATMIAAFIVQRKLQ